MSASTHPPRTGPPAGGPTPPPPDDRSAAEPAGVPPGPATRPIGWAVALIGAGVLWLLHLVGVTIAWGLVLPMVIIGIGLVLLAGGRRVAHSGLIGLGVVLMVIALILPMSPVVPSVTAGDQTHTVTDLTELEAAYRLGAGTLTIDLRDLELPAGTTELAATVSMGELVVLVADDVTVTGTGQAVAGEVVSFGRTTAGFAPRRALTEAGVTDGPVLDLELRTFFGRIEVTR